MIILGIETSCDETAVAIVKVVSSPSASLRASKFQVISNIVSSQVKIHKKYGGIVPEVAARNHVKNMLSVLDKALSQARVKPVSPKASRRGRPDIDYIAVTTQPGLITSLLVGTETAKVLSYVWQKPLVAVNHIKAHLYANWLPRVDGRLSSLHKDLSRGSNLPKMINFPAIGLVVSGGHTELYLMKDEFNFKLIGQTLDDAAGEAFDKVAKILGLDYPGGPIIARIAKKGNPNAFDLPRAMIDSGDFNFSFSGLKTAVLYTTKKLNNLTTKQHDLAASFQQAVVDVLIEKTIRAVKKYQAKSVLLGGGVAANDELRKQMAQNIKNAKLHLPPPRLCTDNAAIVAAAAYFKILKKDFTPWSKVKVKPN